MSDILIKGMEMPTSCMLCSFCVEEADPANGEMCMVTGSLMPPCTRERLDNCPLIPVPKHGRLIDAEWLKQLYDDPAYGEDVSRYHVAIPVILANIDDAPTIIEAEEGDQ